MDEEGLELNLRTTSNQCNQCHNPVTRLDLREVVLYRVHAANLTSRAAVTSSGRGGMDSHSGNSREYWRCIERAENAHSHFASYAPPRASMRGRTIHGVIDDVPLLRRCGRRPSRVFF